MKKNYTLSSDAQNTKSNSLGGFSLIEVVIVVALISVITGFGMAFSTSSIARANITGERDLFVSLLTRARAQAIANVDESGHGVRIDVINKKYFTYANTLDSQGKCSGSVVSGSERETPMATSATFSGPLDYCFAPLSIRVSSTQAGTTTIAFAGQSYPVSVNTVGRIDW